MQGSLPAVHPQGRFAATPIDGAMAWLTAHWPLPAGVLLGPAHATGPAVLNRGHKVPRQHQCAGDARSSETWEPQLQWGESGFGTGDSSADAKSESQR